METIAFDTLAYSKQLIEAGVDEKIAETHAKMQVKILKNMLTKNDIDFSNFATHQDLLTLEQRLIEKFLLHINTATSDRQVIRGEARQGFTTAAADRQAIRNEMNQGFTAAAADRQAIRNEMNQGFTAAAADRQAIRDEMNQGFTAAAADRQAIRDEMRAGFTANVVDHEILRNEMKNMQLRIIGILGSMMVAGFTILGIIMRLLTQ